MGVKQGDNFRIPILTYHSIDNSGSVISTSPEKFRSQMQYLNDSSFNVISLNETISHLYENKPFLPKTVAITFDDGFKSIYDIAYPVIKEFKFKAAVFVVTGYCGKNNQWNGQPENIPIFDLLGWDEIIDMSNNGIEIAAHTISHPSLPELSMQQVKDEVAGSKGILEERLGRNIQSFAYPYGKYTDEIRHIVKNEFQCAFSTELGYVTFKSDIYYLPRIDMYYFSENNLFTWLETPFFPLYIKFRKVLRFLKRRINLHLTSKFSFIEKLFLQEINL